MRSPSPQIIAVAAFIGPLLLGGVVVLSGCGSGSRTLDVPQIATRAEMGRALFFDADLSQPRGQACATCHQSAAAFADPRQDSPTSEGAIAGRFGSRQTPSLKYMSYSPDFHFDAEEQDYIGGQFWDGRARDLNDQVHFPLLNPAEMNNDSKAQVVARIQSSSLGRGLRQLYGNQVFDSTDAAFDAIADAIATFESSPEFRPFTSKYDFYLKGQATLTPAEARGLALFNGKAGCASCHPSAPSEDGTPPLFTDFTYDNIGLPRNDRSRFFQMPHTLNPDGPAFNDPGLAQTTGRAEDRGRFKVPTLRNVTLTAPYFHNGVMTTLEQAVQFYNQRDSGAFGPPEVSETMNREELGNLGLSDAEVSDIVAFLQTLTDGYGGLTGVRGR